MTFVNEFMEIKKQLEGFGHIVLIPDLEFESNDHDWVKKKGDAITKHFRKIDDSDCVLITNYEKNGLSNYIGGNTFLEIGYAYGTGKKIYILNDIPEISAYKDEILAMQPIILNGDIYNI